MPVILKQKVCSYAVYLRVLHLPGLGLLGRNVPRRSEDHMAGGMSPRVSGLDRAPEIKLCCPLCLNTEADSWEWERDSSGPGG